MFEITFMSYWSYQLKQIRIRKKNAWNAIENLYNDKIMTYFQVEIQQRMKATMKRKQEFRKDNIIVMTKGQRIKYVKVILNK